MTRWLHQPGKGFSLIELTVAIVVIALAAPPLTALIYNVMTQGTQTDKRTAASALAKGLMEEILSKAFEDPQLAAGSFGTEEGNRADYDDIDDYDGLSQSPPADNLGSPLTQFSAFRSQVLVENVNPEDLNGPAAADGSTNFKRVIVTVSWNNGQRSVRLTGLRSSFAPLNNTKDGMTFIERLPNLNKDLTFRVRNDSGDDLYITHLKLSWTSPAAYYKTITLQAEGGTNYGTVWDINKHNNIRLSSGQVAMFNQGACVLVPNGTVMLIQVQDFRTSKDSVGGIKKDMSTTSFTAELWAAPDRYLPITIPPLP